MLKKMKEMHNHALLMACSAKDKREYIRLEGPQLFLQRALGLQPIVAFELQ